MVGLFLSPMANAGGVSLALAVARAGAIPSLPAAAMALDDVARDLHMLRRAGFEPVLNFFAHQAPVRDAAEDLAWLKTLQPLYKKHGLENACPLPVDPPRYAGPQSDANLPNDDPPSVGDAPSLLPSWYQRTSGRNPFDGDALAFVLEHNVRRVSFHFGLPTAAAAAAGGSDGCSRRPDAFLSQLRSMVAAADAKRSAEGRPYHPFTVMCSATTVEEAVFLRDAGVDGIIAQGLEAGGHRGSFLRQDLEGQRPTLELVRLCGGQRIGNPGRLHAAFSVPIGRATSIEDEDDRRMPNVSAPFLLAAGGISNRKDVLTAVDAGADAVQIGTAFLNTHESVISPLFRARMRSGKEGKSRGSDVGEAAEGVGLTVVTNAFTGRYARGLKNEASSFIDHELRRRCGSGQQEGQASFVPRFPTAVDGWAPLRKHLESEGRWDATPMLCGTGIEVVLGAPPVPAEDVVKALMGRGQCQTE